MEDLSRLQSMVDESDRIVFFGGAGVSTESGIPDFRSVDGLYRQKYRDPPETILSHTFFLKHPEAFFEFYRDKLVYPDAKPNAAHRKLAELEAVGKLSAVITQNIDGLHQAAGGKNVLELHGSVLRNHCVDCGKRYPVSFMMESTGVPRCGCGGMVRPDVVLYEEALDGGVLEEAVCALKKADMVIVGGTSLAVYPAAGLLDYYRGNRLVLINRSPTRLDGSADLVISKNIAEVLGALTV